MSKASLALFVCFSFLFPIVFVVYFNRFSPCTGNNVYLSAALVAGAWGVVFGTETANSERSTVFGAVIPFLWSVFVIIPFALFFAWAGKMIALLGMSWAYHNLHWTSWLLCM